MRLSPDAALWTRAPDFWSRAAIVSSGRSYTYAELSTASARVAARLLAGLDDLGEARIVFMVQPGFEYVAVQWGIWRAGGIAVPLAPSQAPA